MPDDPAQPRLGKHGGPRTKGQRNPETRPTGVRRDYILRRLERDGRHDLAEAIREGRVSAYTIACELGWTRRPFTNSNLTVLGLSMMRRDLSSGR